MALEHLDGKILDKVKERLWTVSCSLEGIGGLFTQGMREPNLDGEEFYGIGNLLKKIAEEVSILEDILNCGRDSRADERNGVDKDEDDTEDDTETPSDNKSSTNFELFLKRLIPLIKEAANENRKEGVENETH